MTVAIDIRAATSADLDAINHVITAAVMTWDLPERVKRLSLPSYYYEEIDLDHFQMLLACIEDKPVAVIALEHENRAGESMNKGTLIHGLFVDPEFQRRGIGTYLFKQAEDIARQQAAAGLMVRAQKDAIGFFSTMGMVKLSVSNEKQDYADRYWKQLS